MTIKKPADFYAAIALLAAMGAVYHQSLAVDTSMNIAMGPLFFPYILMGAITLLSLCLLLQSISFATPGSKEKKEQAINREGLLLQCCTVLLLFGYVLLLPVLSYIPATFIFLLVLMLILGPRSPRNILVSAITAGAVTGVLYGIFAKVLLLFLP